MSLSPCGSYLTNSKFLGQSSVFTLPAWLSIVISALRSLETGQPAFALFAAVSNACLVSAGHFRGDIKMDFGNRKATVSFFKLTDAVVRILSAVRPGLTELS